MDLHQNVRFIDDADDATTVVDHRQLRDIGLAHPFESGEQRVGRADGYDFARFVTMQNQIAQIAVHRPNGEALLLHPDIVKHFRKIFVAAVANEGDDAFRFGLLSAIAKRSCQQRAR